MSGVFKPLLVESVDSGVKIKKDKSSSWQLQGDLEHITHEDLVLF